MSDLPAGAAFGSLVHAVLENADPFAPDLAVELETHVREQLGWWASTSSRRSWPRRWCRCMTRRWVRWRRG